MIWLRQFDIYHSQTQAQCGICCCYNSGRLPHIKRVLHLLAGHRTDVQGYEAIDLLDQNLVKR